jgi:streptogramin lyase
LRVAAALTLSAVLAASGIGIFATASITLSGASPLPEFDAPSGLAVANGNVWVTNEADNSVSEVNASSGALVKMLTAKSFGFDQPSAIVHIGAHLFVANVNNTVSIITASTSANAGILSGKSYGFAHPVALAKSGGKLLVLSAGASGSSGALSVVDSASHRVIANVKDASFVGADAIAASASDAYIADDGSDSVTDVNLSTDSVSDVITDPGIVGPDGVAISDGSVWVSDNGSNAASQIDATTDTVVQTANDSSYGFSNPSVAIASDGNVFIASPLGASPMVTKLSATTGEAYWYMCNTNGPYYFSNLSAFAVSGTDLWVASASGANNPLPDAATGSLTELLTTSGALVATFPAT